MPISVSNVRHFPSSSCVYDCGARNIVGFAWCLDKRSSNGMFRSLETIAIHNILIVELITAFKVLRVHQLASYKMPETFLDARQLSGVECS